MGSLKVKYWESLFAVSLQCYERVSQLELYLILERSKCKML